MIPGFVVSTFELRGFGTRMLGSGASSVGFHLRVLGFEG